MGKLTDTKLKSLKPKEKDYALTDGNGLQVLVKPNKRKKWEFIYSSPTQYTNQGKKDVGRLPLVITLRQL